jgi:Ca-activated chloride channel family protein
MSFASPLWLLGLLLLPLALWAWWARRRRAPRYAIRFTALPALREAVGGGGAPAWRPYVPVAFMLAALAALVFTLAKPQRTVAVPIERATIMLVTDHSRSMEADDVLPNRLSAAQAAARTFLKQLPKQVRVGVVAFSTAPDAVQTPTNDHAAVLRIIDAQFPDGATAIGDALIVALNAIDTGVKAGKRPPAAIVLLSDGKTTTGHDPVGVALDAGRRHVPIYTVSLGTNEGVVTAPGYGYIPVPPDPETLGAIARESGGHAFSAQDESRLSSIYKNLGSKLGTKKNKREATAAFAVGALVLLLGAAATSVRFAPSLP